MATIDKLNYLNNTKLLIKGALNDLGAGITNDDTFRSYVDKISEIKQEYPSNTIIAQTEEEGGNE